MSGATGRRTSLWVEVGRKTSSESFPEPNRGKWKEDKIGDTTVQRGPHCYHAQEVTFFPFDHPSKIMPKECGSLQSAEIFFSTISTKWPMTLRQASELERLKHCPDIVVKEGDWKILPAHQLKPWWAAWSLSVSCFTSCLVRLRLFHHWLWKGSSRSLSSLVKSRA